MPGIGDLIAAKNGATAEPEPEGPALGADAPEAPVKAEELGPESEDKPAAVPVKHLAAERARRREAEERATRFESELKGSGEIRTAFEAMYSKFEKPLEQMREDAAFAQAAFELRNDPDVQKALSKIASHHHGATRAVNDRTAKPEQPATDPRLDALLQERVKDRADALLESAKVRPELRGAITSYVLSQNPDPSREAVWALMQEYVNAQGWSRQFLRGGSEKAPRQILPNPGGLNAGTPKPQGGEKPSAKPKESLSNLQSQGRNKLQELMQQRGM